MDAKTEFYELDRNDRDVCGHLVKAQAEILKAILILQEMGGDGLVKKFDIDKAYAILSGLVPVRFVFM